MFESHRQEEKHRGDKLPSMPLTQGRRLIQKTTKKSCTQGKQQMLKSSAQLTHIQDTQKECKKLLIRVKRLSLENIPVYVQGKNNSLKLNTSNSVGNEHTHSAQPNYNSHLSACVKTLRDQCTFKLQPKEKEVQICAGTLELQDQCTTNSSENQKKSELHPMKSIKKAVVRLKRFKVENIATTNTIPAFGSACANEAVLQNNICDRKNKPQLKNKIPVVRIKRLKLANKLGTIYRTKDIKQNSNIKPAEKGTDAKMKTRSQNKKSVNAPCKKIACARKAKENLVQQKSPPKVVRKHNELITEVVITPERRLNLKRLSLTKGSLKQKTWDGVTTRSTITSDNANKTKAFEITRFSPVRNSTVLGIEEKTLKDESLSNKNTSTSEEKLRQKSLTNKPDLIEQILFSDDISSEEDHGNCIEEKSMNENQGRRKKIFHRMPKSSTSKKVLSEADNIFEFFSQSDTSSSEKSKRNDPTADIIKKMISAGKVQVAVNVKGKGRLLLKRGPQKNGRKKHLPNKTKAPKTVGKKEKPAASAVCKIVKDNVDGTLALRPVPEYIEDGHHDATEYFNDLPEIDEQMSEGGFSQLARSVLLQQTKKYENTRKKDRSEQRRLLEMARKFVSTPALNRKNGTLATTDLSPIQKIGVQHRPVCPSPWRIDEDAHLPKTFNFSKNNSYLPSFSSDYIPSTPTKNLPNCNSHIYNNSNTTLENYTAIGQGNSDDMPKNKIASDSVNQLQNSRGSSNDSNAENMPPPVSTLTRSVQNNDENNDIFNLRQLPNPRRALEHRSPLKTINIIEVVSLPPWKKPVNIDAHNEESNVQTVVCNKSKDNETLNADNMFGFEEFLDQNSDEDVQTLSTSNVTSASRQSTNRNLHKKLKELKKWRPKRSDQNESNVRGKPCGVFDDNEGRPKQRRIKEMLCSTLINEKNSKTKMQVEDSAQTIENDFFNEFEPEASFEKQPQPQRTYARPVKRKRKCRKNFVMFRDSSEESNSDSDGEKHKRKNMSKKKRLNEAHANDKANLELNSFINEFNIMCKDVDNYELHVE